MVLVLECFPSNHQSVNDVRELYRASIMSANASEDQTTPRAEPIANDTPAVPESLEDIDEDGIAQEYPGGMRDFLDKSKQQLYSPDDMENNLKKVQQLVEKMTNTALNVPTENAVANRLSVDNFIEKDGLSTDTLFAIKDVSRKTKSFTSNEKSPSTVSKISHSKRTEKSFSIQECPSFRNETLVPSPKPPPPINISSLTNTNSKSDRKTPMTSGGPKKPKNNSTPRYLDVFTKQKSSNELRDTSSSSQLFTNPRLSAKFDQNWKPLAVSVVNIEL